MSAQNITKRQFGSSVGGSPIMIKSSSSAAPELIHNTDPPASSQFSVYAELHNKSNARVLIHVRWNASADVTLADFTGSYNVPPYGSIPIMDGMVYEQTHAVSAATNGINAYADDAGDVDKVLFVGYLLEINQEPS